MESKAEKLDAVAKIFLNDLGIDKPTDRQIETVKRIDDHELRVHAVRKMLSEGKTSGQIAMMTGMNISTAKSMIRRVKNNDE